MKIGIPYANVEFESDGTLVHVCPICGERVPEKVERSTGEMTTNNYGTHYEAKHETA